MTAATKALTRLQNLTLTSPSETTTVSPPVAPVDYASLPSSAMLQVNGTTQLLEQACAGNPKEIRHFACFIHGQVMTGIHDGAACLFSSFLNAATVEAKEQLWRCFIHDEERLVWLLQLLNKVGKDIRQLSFHHDKNPYEAIGNIVVRCPNLKSLRIRGPALGPNDQHFLLNIAQCTQLEALDLSEVSGIDFLYLGGLINRQKLRSLALSVTNSTSWDNGSMLLNLPLLESVQIAGYCRESSIKLGLKNTLHTLDLSGISASGEAIKQLHRLPKIQSLSAAVQNGYEIAEVAKLTNLRTLNLDCRMGGGWCAEYLLHLTNLQSLTLYLKFNESISVTTCAELLAKLPNLVHFAVNKVRCPDLDRRSLPVEPSPLVDVSLPTAEHAYCALTSAITKATKLQSLSLDCQFAIPKNVCDAIASLPHLKHLELSAQSVHSLRSDSLQLMSLAITQATADSPLVKVISAMSSLTQLELSFPISEEDVKLLSGLQNLHTFIYRRQKNQSPEFSINNLTKITSIKTLRNCHLFGVSLTSQAALAVIENAKQLRFFSAPGLSSTEQTFGYPDKLRHLHSLFIGVDWQEFCEQIGKDLLCDPVISIDYLMNLGQIPTLFESSVKNASFG